MRTEDECKKLRQAVEMITRAYTAEGITFPKDGFINLLITLGWDKLVEFASVAAHAFMGEEWAERELVVQAAYFL